jgi:hypothetical protein
MPTRPTSGYDNDEIPDSMPLQNRGAIPVLVRLVDAELGEHFRPAEARRWTETHVMIASTAPIRTPAGVRTSWPGCGPRTCTGCCDPRTSTSRRPGRP